MVTVAIQTEGETSRNSALQKYSAYNDWATLEELQRSATQERRRLVLRSTKRQERGNDQLKVCTLKRLLLSDFLT